MALTKVTYSMIAGAAVNPVDFGADSTGSNDSTTAIQAAIDSMSAGSCLYFPEGVFDFDVVDFDVENCVITGPGIVKGTINIKDQSQGFIVDGITFDASTISTTPRGITLDTCTIGAITNCFFLNLETAIFVNGSDASGQVSRITVSGNQYKNCSYFISTEQVTGFTFGVADWIVSNNSGNALVDHVFMNTFDGVTINDNVFFGSANPDYTRNGIRLVYGTWTTIHDNKFFESGSESIYIDQITNVNIHDNLHAWSGEYIQTDAIYIKGVPTPGGAGFTNGTIHDETIIEPSGAGIHLDANQQLVQIHHNYIYRPGANTRYFGSTPLTGATVGVLLDTGVLYTTTNNNVVITGTNTLPQGGTNQTNTHIDNLTSNGGFVETQTIEKFLTLSGTETSVNVGNWNYIAVAQSGATNLSSITNSEGDKTISFRFYNSNTTLINSANLKLRAGSNVTPAENNVITFIVYSTSAVEIARNF